MAIIITINNGNLKCIKELGPSCWLVQKLNKLGYESFSHPPYTPDLSPTNYQFFKHLDNFFQGKCFHN